MNRTLVRKWRDLAPKGRLLVKVLPVILSRITGGFDPAIPASEFPIYELVGVPEDACFPGLPSLYPDQFPLFYKLANDAIDGVARALCLELVAVLLHFTDDLAVGEIYAAKPVERLARGVRQTRVEIRLTSRSVSGIDSLVRQKRFDEWASVLRWC